MSDLARTIKLIMNYISKKRRDDIETDTTGCLVLTIKKNLFFKNHVSKSLAIIHSSDKLSNMYNAYCKNNFSKKNIILYNES